MSKFEVNDVVKFNYHAKSLSWYRTDVFYTSSETFVVSEVSPSGDDIKLANDPSEDWISDHHLELVKEQPPKRRN